MSFSPVLSDDVTLAMSDVRTLSWLNENAAKCKKCKTVVASKGCKTNSIMEHLKIKHRLNLKQCVVFERFSEAANISCVTSSVQKR